MSEKITENLNNLKIENEVDKISEQNTNETEDKYEEKENSEFESSSVKKILMDKIIELEKILEDEDTSDDLIISYMLIDENQKISDNLTIEEVWILIKKISDSWNTINLLGMETPITKENLSEYWIDIVKNKALDNNDHIKIDLIENTKINFNNEKLDIYSIKPIIKIIFESIIFGYKKIIETFN